MLTLEQLIKLGNNIGVDIFAGVTLPEDNPLDRETLINTIIEKCGLNIPMYADPYVMASAVTLWSARNQYTFEHVGKIYSAVYSPIENKDYYEDISVTRERDMTDNTVGSLDRTENVDATVDKTTTHSGTDTTTDEMETSAYNASDYQDKDKTTSTLVHGEAIRDAGSTGSDKTIDADSTTDKTIDEDETTTTTSHQHGNIGVSTFFDLETGEYRLLSSYNPYSFIAGLFENELTLFVY